MYPICLNDILLNVTLIPLLAAGFLADELKNIFEGSGESGNKTMKWLLYCCEIQMTLVEITTIITVSLHQMVCSYSCFLKNIIQLKLFMKYLVKINFVSSGD